MRKTIILLVMISLLSALTLMGCTDTPSPLDESKGDISGSGDNVEGVYTADIPSDLDFEGRAFTFLTCGAQESLPSEVVYNDPDRNTENLTERVNEAVLERNRLIEELLNIEIKEIYIFDAARRNSIFANTVRSGAQAGLSEYEVIVPCIYDGATLAADGYLYDLNRDIPYLNMEQPWWEQTFNEELTINGKLYFTVGDIGTANKAASSAIMFNKRLIEEHELDNPYTLVKEKKWTMDKAFSMAKTISFDDDQDGRITWRDTMGWSGQTDDMKAFFYASGEKIARRGADGYPEIAMYNSRSVDVLDKMLSLVQDKGHYISADDYFHESKWPAELTRKPFLEGRCLFFSGVVKSTDYMRDMEDDFGILPEPLFNDTQDRYYSLINPWTGNCFAVPKSVNLRDLEFVGIVLEALGAESKNILHPAYYDVALKYQRTRDEESIEMLDIIFSTRGCDLGMIYGWGGLDAILKQLISQSPGTFASAYQAKEDMAQTQLEKTIGFFKQND